MSWSDNKLIRCVSKQATGRKVLLFLGLQVMMGGLMFGVVHQFSVLAHGLIPLDVTFFYGIEDVVRFMAAIPDGAAQFYLYVLFPLDLLYPALYSFSYALIVAYMLERLAQRGHAYPQWLVLYPFATALFDYLENVGLVLMFHLQPALPQPLLFATSLCSGMKWAAAFIGLGILAYLTFKFVTTRTESAHHIS